MLPTLLESAATSDSGKHTRALEREPLLDQAVYGYAERLEVQTVGVPCVGNVQEVPKQVQSTVYSPYGLGIKIIPEPKNTFECKAERVPIHKVQYW